MADTQTEAEGRGPDASQLIRYRDDETVADPAITVDAFREQSNAIAVRVEPGDDVRELVPFLDRLALIEVNFPAFGDGRGYSAARILREEGYTGELRAVGDVLVDQVAYMRRCGFDAFAPDAPLDGDDLTAALERWPQAYQSAADMRVPIWTKRHGTGA